MTETEITIRVRSGEEEKRNTNEEGKLRVFTCDGFRTAASPPRKFDSADDLPERALNLSSDGLHTDLSWRGEKQIQNNQSSEKFRINLKFEAAIGVPRVV